MQSWKRLEELLKLQDECGAHGASSGRGWKSSIEHVPGVQLILAEHLILRFGRNGMPTTREVVCRVALGCAMLNVCFGNIVV